jgi:hypothetical protein
VHFRAFKFQFLNIISVGVLFGLGGVMPLLAKIGQHEEITTPVE